VNLETREADSSDPAMLYSVEFPQASSSCQIKFWYVIRGGLCELNASLIIKEERQALLYRLRSSSNITTWAFANIDLGKFF
jgi:hypothetical protein